MLGDWHRDANDVCLLEGIGSDELRTDLTGDCQQRNRVHVSVSDCGHQVRCTRARGRDADTELAASRGITFGSVTGTLFVTNQNVTNLLGVHQRVVSWQNRSARQTENIRDAQILQAANDRLRAG